MISIMVSNSREHHQLFFSVIMTLVFCLQCWHVQATHNRAGEITYEQIGDLTIRATIVTYTRTSSFNADRDSLTLFWGDGDSTVVQRSNGNGFELPSDIKRNEYVSEHTYPTRGTYKLSMTDPNRIAGILNIDAPNSVNIRFYIETTFTLLEPRFQGRNSSAILLQPPIDFACAGEIFTYNPNAYDVDGDSLSYELVMPFSEQGVEVPNYELPDKIASGPDNVISLDPFTGAFSWDAPQFTGEYNITYKINEYRSGVLINSIIRDMQILVRSCMDENSPPMITTIDEICVVAGELINIELFALDVDSNEILTITASGGPFELSESPAILTTGLAMDNSMLSGEISWQTTCDHVSREFYQIVVRATDEASRPNSGLAVLRTIRVKVVAPPPTNPEAENVNNIVTIAWDNPYDCQEGMLFQGFSVWRKTGSSFIDLDTCRGGLEGLGYERIIFLTNEEQGNQFIARDAEIDPGQIYCYRVIAEFAELTSLGNPYNTTQSLASNEVCILSSGDEPIITNVSILNTDNNNGVLRLQWINPTNPAIDTALLIGPYETNISGIDNINGNGLSLVQSFSYGTGDFRSFNDTIWEFSDLDTRNNGHSYGLSFESGSGTDAFRSSSDIASSVLLNTRGSDEKINLNWEEKVPWNNYNYKIYQIVNNERQLKDSTSNQSITINGLENGLEYCYVIESIGTYNISEIRTPLVNYSNESCATAMDDIAPCPPEIQISSICDDNVINLNQELINTVTWRFDNSSCIRAFDIQYFRVYFSESDAEPMTLLAEVNVSDNSFDHFLNENIAGCYAISVVDMSGNESSLSQTICVDNCPSYILPNTFTPNNDNANDFFIPRQNRFIERIEFKVFNRWGQKVFETVDPFINWDGMNLNQKELAEGTYYYTCQVFEKRVAGITQGEILNGTIQLIR